MPSNRQIKPPSLNHTRNTIADRITKSEVTNNIIVNFSKLKLTPVCLSGKFNNHFKDEQHFGSVVANFLGTILPKITSHTYNEIGNGGPEGQVLHFHTIDDEHRVTVREILEEYHYPSYNIDQMFEGNDMIEFSASLGHKHAARIVCHRVENVLFLLFFDTNHHIYLNEKYVRDSMFYESCPVYIENNCPYMPTDCFAVSYLDEKQLEESFGYSYSPQD